MVNNIYLLFATMSKMARNDWNRSHTLCSIKNAVQLSRTTFSIEQNTRRRCIISQTVWQHPKMQTVHNVAKVIVNSFYQFTLHCNSTQIELCLTQPNCVRAIAFSRKDKVSISIATNCVFNFCYTNISNIYIYIYNCCYDDLLL